MTSIALIKKTYPFGTVNMLVSPVILKFIRGDLIAMKLIKSESFAKSIGLQAKGDKSDQLSILLPTFRRLLVASSPNSPESKIGLAADHACSVPFLIRILVSLPILLAQRLNRSFYFFKIPVYDRISFVRACC